MKLYYHIPLALITLGIASSMQNISAAENNPFLNKKNPPTRRTHQKATRHQCDICSKTLSTRQKLSRHKLIHAGVKQFRCTHCSKEFYRKDNCDRHVKMRHQSVSAYTKKILNKEKPSFGCEVCGKKYKYFGHYKRHIETKHKAQQPVSATMVDKNTSPPSMPTSHHTSTVSLETVREDPEQTQCVKCEFCGKHMHQSHYKKHIETKHKSKQLALAALSTIASPSPSLPTLTSPPIFSSLPILDTERVSSPPLDTSQSLTFSVASILNNMEKYETP